MTDGTRTRDNQNHNLGLYQLSYGHQRTPKVAPKSPNRQAPLVASEITLAKQRKPPLAHRRFKPFLLLAAGGRGSPLLFRF